MSIAKAILENERLAGHHRNKRRKRPTPTPIPETAGERAVREDIEAEKAAEALLPVVVRQDVQAAPRQRRNTTGNVWGKPPKPDTPAERAATATRRAAVQKKYRQTAIPSAEALVKNRERKKDWATASREQKRADRFAFASIEILDVLKRFGLLKRYWALFPY